MGAYEYIVQFNPHFDSGYVTNQGNVVAFSAERQMVHEIVHAINNLSDPTGDFSLPNPDYVGDTVRLTNTIMASLGLDEPERPTYAASVPNRFIGRDMTGNATVDVVLTTSIEVGLGYPGHNLNTTLNTTLLRDLMIGGRHDGEFYSGRGNDFIYAGGGVDTIDAGADDDHVFGEEGDDFVYGGLGNDTLDGGEDTDTLTYENLSSSVHINLDQAQTGDLGANFTASGTGQTVNEMRISLLPVFVAVAVSVAFFAEIASAEPPLKGYRGILTPTDYYGIFTLFDPSIQEKPVHPTHVDRDATYFRLHGVETTPGALRKFAAGLVFYCEELGVVSSRAVGDVSIVSCRNVEMGSLARKLREEGAAKSICSESGPSSGTCEY